MLDKEYAQQAQFNTSGCGIAGCGTIGNPLSAAEPSKRPPLYDRIERAHREAQGKIRQAERMEELANLLAKYPEIGRMLELYEDVRQ